MKKTRKARLVDIAPTVTAGRATLFSFGAGAGAGAGFGALASQKLHVLSQTCLPFTLSHAFAPAIIAQVMPLTFMQVAGFALQYDVSIACWSPQSPLSFVA